MTIKATIRHCISNSWVLSFMFFTRLPLIKSRVRVGAGGEHQGGKGGHGCGQHQHDNNSNQQVRSPDSMAGMMVS